MARNIQVNVRMSVDLKSQIQAAAAANGRSFNAEMVQRLAASLAADEIHRPPRNANMTNSADIVERLRVRNRLLPPGLAQEAADEIERLREEIAVLRNPMPMATDAARAEAYRAEIERLRAGS